MTPLWPDLRIDLARMFARYCSHGQTGGSYGYRVHPILGQKQFHSGVDIAKTAETPIQLPCPGRVWKAWYDQKPPNGHGGGWSVVMDHDTSAWGEIISLDKQISSTGYCHMICLNDWQSVKVGNYLNAGTVLGWVGTSGLSSGYHLHFTLRIFSEGGNVVTDDPFPHLLSWCGMYDEMKEYERIKLESRGIEIPIHGIGENRG